MAKPYPSIHLVQSGLIQGIQDWSIGFTMWAPGLHTPTQAELTGFAADAMDAAAAWWNVTGGPQQLASSDTDLRGVTAYWYPAGASKAAALGVAAIPPHTASQSAANPNQSSVCLSLRTDTPGRSGRGRVYLVANGVPLTQHQLTAVQTGDTAVAAGLHINDLNSISFQTGSLIVSVGTEKLPTPPEVVNVTCDSRVDTQRRRTDKEPVLFQSSGPVGP